MSVSGQNREPNPCGYLSDNSVGKKRWPGIQLQTLLKLQNNEKVFRILKKNIMRLMVKHMDLNLTATKQVDKLRAIENELKEQNPEIFAAEESEKRLYVTTRMVVHEHANRRHVLRKRNQQRSAAPTRNSTISTCKQHRRAGSEHNRDNHGMPESASQTLPRSSESSMGTKPDRAYKKNDPNEYPDIYNFLKTSTPPMTHLLDAFIEFGCVNADFLLAMSSWTFEEIRRILDRLSLGPNGRQLTEMEIFILQNHFKEHFTRLGKR